MARRNHLDDFTRGRMIGKLEEGRTVTSLAAEFGINKRVSFRAIGKHSKPQVPLLEKLVVAARVRQLQGMTDISSCRRKETDGSQQASLLSNFLQQRGDKCRGLLWPDAFTKGAYSPEVLCERCLTLQVNHRRHRLQWCREHKNWTTDRWSRVLFTDESRFSSRSDGQRVLIWREIGTRFYTSNIKERYHYAGPGVLVWGGIMLNGRTELHIFDRGSVIGDRYCKEELLESEDITRMDWPAYSPDLNPIEHVWDALGRRIAKRLHHPENTQQLKQMLIEEWALLPQEMLH
ncbi:transposable element Tcb2 transposase [Trichonephila clavipes]|nr:transposable element Tcb2 transposase [Trichonephila clavipes]